MKQTQNQFYGSHEELPDKLPPGSIYVCSDHNLVFISKSDGTPVPIMRENYADFGFSSINSIYVDGSYYDLSNSDSGSLIKFSSDENWNLSLPRLDLADNDYKIIVSQDGDESIMGRISPYHEDKIDNSSHFDVFGSGYITIQKGNETWNVTNMSLFSNRVNKNKSIQYDFDDLDFIRVTHELGYIPIVQVWHKFGDGENDYTLSNAEVCHDWSNMNEFSVYFNSPQTGKILYF